MSNKKNNKKKAQTSKKKSNKKLLITVVSVVALVAIAVGIWLIATPKKEAEPETMAVTVSVLHKNDTVWAMTFYTTSTTLGEALIEKEIIRPQDYENGVIHTVRGEKADPAVDKAFWKLYIDAKDGPEDVYNVVLENGKDYRLEYTIGD